jgi:hypothetical protein
MLEETVLLQITDQVGQLIDDYKDEINKGYKTLGKKFSMGFKVKLKPQGEAVKVITTMTFSTEPKPEPSGVIKEQMEVIVGGKE